MDTTIGFVLVVIAGLMQGSFILPMTLVKNWKWENIWFVFSLLGMVILNLFLAWFFVNDLLEAYSAVASKDFLILGLFGFGWGLGAVFFGIGMDKLGMSIGYPIIMGLTATIGGLVPLFVHHTADILKPTGLIMIVGTLIVVYGIIICSKAAAQKETNTNKGFKANLTAGLIIAVAAGALSSLPNIGLSFGAAITEAAINSGTSKAMAGNAIWALFFSVGFIPNLFYTGWLLVKNGTFKLMYSEKSFNNLGLGLLMAIMWIGSFYLYGISSFKLGSLGNIVGWPLFISISILVGNLWGIWRGEWRNSSAAAKRILYRGLTVLILAMIIIGLSNLF
jgi:L-rhamnose-H+ transport protein